MAISKETEEWLQGLEREGGMSGSALLELRQHFSHQKADEFVKGSVLRQSDYSRQMAEIQKSRGEAEAAQAALAAKEEAVGRFQSELAQWKAGAEENYTKALAEREKAEARAQAAMGRLKSTAAQVGISEADILRDLESGEVVIKPTETTQNKGNYVTREDIQQTAREAAILEGILGDVADEHRELFGTRLNRTELVQEAIRSGKSVEAYWSEKFKVGDKRKELENAAIDRRIAEAVAAKEAELRSSLPGQVLPRAVDRDDPMSAHKIFSNKALMESNNSGSAAPTGGVSAAVAAFQAGKYHLKH